MTVVSHVASWTLPQDACRVSFRAPYLFGIGSKDWVDLTIARGVVLCIGGPALVYYVTPTEEELFKVS